MSQIGHFAVEEKVPFLARKWADAQTKRAFNANYISIQSLIHILLMLLRLALAMHGCIKKYLVGNHATQAEIFDIL